MRGITRLLLGVAFGAVLAPPALAIDAAGELQGKEKLKVSACGNAKAVETLAFELSPNGTWEAVTSQAVLYSGSYSDLGKGKFAFEFNVVSYDALYASLTTWASDFCGFPFRILAATQSTFTGKLAKGKAKGTIRLSFDGEAFDGTPGTAVWTGKYKGSYIETPP